MKKPVIFVILCFTLVLSSNAQVDSSGKKVVPSLFAPGEIVTFTELMPEFPGGQDSMIRFINRVRQYPEAALKNRLQGKVMVQFVVMENGSIDTGTVNVVRSPDPVFNAEAMRIIKVMPPWIPGADIIGKPVKVRYTLPVVFRLD